MACNSIGVVGFLVVLIAVLTGFYYRNIVNNERHLRSILNGMLSLERKVKVTNSPVAAVAFEATLDIFVESLDLLKSLGIDPPQRAYPHEVIDSEMALAETFAYFFEHSVASSRYVSNKDLFRKIVEKANHLQHTKMIVGGTATCFAKRLALNGWKTHLTVPMTESTRKFVPSSIDIVGEIPKEDDIHMIFEFPGFEHWGDKFVSQRSNRMVLHTDVNNPYLKSLDTLKQVSKTENPALVVIGGLHMMDSFPYKEGERAQRLDSIGMNEQDLPNLLSMLKYDNITKVATQKPRVAVILDQMRQVYKILRSKPASNAKRRVTRLHLHTLAFQVMMTTRESPWTNSLVATAKASLTATRHVCGSNFIHTNKSRVIMDDSFSISSLPGSDRVPFNAERPVSCWSEDDYQFCVTPVLVCTEIVHTAGGGDNISAGGLSVQAK
ncbi:ADP-dependent glucokinase [Exaiptasia diaphana]|nr:ADP-dependent glucokinase [Exaiptasia diaphana]